MPRPWIRADFILTRARIPASAVVHFQQYEVAKAAFLQSPRGTEARNPAAHDHQRNFLCVRGCRKPHSVANCMARVGVVIDPAARDPAITLGAHADERSAAQLQKLTAGFQWLMSFQSLSYIRTSTWSFKLFGATGSGDISGGNWNSAGMVAVLTKRKPDGREVGGRYSCVPASTNPHSPNDGT